MPTGRQEFAGGNTLNADEDEDEDVLALFSSPDASSRLTVMPCVSAAGPMNPKPPARDTATANAGPDITRIGALAMKGRDTQG